MKGDATGQGVVPLRTILRNILNLIDSFEARYKEGLDSYDQEFQELKYFSENLKSDANYVCKEGEKTVNRKKNRYKDILPFDYTRVILGDYGDIPGSDYINANFIKGASGSSAYIACQGPLPHTVNDFWRMVVECEVQVIVMACNEQESGKHKCENYWVEEEGVEREFGQVTIWLKKSRQVCPDFLVRTMKIRYPNAKGEPEERSVCQFHYSAWPDHGVPLKVRPLLDMVRLIRDCQTSETLPVLVHCSAGCGRTGTICAIDYVWGLLRLGKLTPDFSLFNLVRDMRRQRIAMVQTKDQYILVHRAVRELFEEQLKIIDSHPYANVDINGLPLEIRADLEEPVYETVAFVSSPSSHRSLDELEDGTGSSRKKLFMIKPVPPPIPNSLEPSTSLTSSVSALKHEKEAENHQRHLSLEHEKLLRGGGSSASSSTSKVTCTPSPSSGGAESQGGGGEVGVSDKDLSGAEKVVDSGGGKRGSFNSKHPATTSKSSTSALFRNPSIVKLKAFFEKSKEDKEKKSLPTLSRAKSDVSSSSRFYTNLAASFSSRGNRNSPSKNSPVSSTSSASKPTSPKGEAELVRSPVEKVKSKPALLAKPNFAVKRSKSLKISRPSQDSSCQGDTVNLISSSSLITSSDVPDSAKVGRTSISSSTSSSSSHLESQAIKVCVKQVEMPKLQKPVSKSVKPESFKATTTTATTSSIATLDPIRRHLEDKQGLGRRRSVEDSSVGQRRGSNQKELPQHAVPSSGGRKPDLPVKPESKPMSSSIPQIFKGIYGTTRIKVGGFGDDSVLDKREPSKLNGKIKKYGTVNARMMSSPSVGNGGGGTLLTRSQSHVWQPPKPSQVPVRIFSDENLSQVGTLDPFDKRKFTNSSYREVAVTCDEADGRRVARKQSLPLAKLFTPEAKPVTSKSNESSPKSLEEPKSLTLTSHSSFLEARRRVPKTNPYANYIPAGEVSKEKGNSPLTQFHFGENVPLLRNHAGAGGGAGNSSESSSNPGTPRTSLPGTPTQSIDVLDSPLSSVGHHYSNTRRGQQSNKPILKGSLSSTPSESDERLDSYRPHLSSGQSSSTSSSHHLVPSNHITGPQKISSVRIAVGVRERRNSFRQAVWKEDQGPTATSIVPVENDKSENIYITTTSSVPYFVKSSLMPGPPPLVPTNASTSSSMYIGTTGGSTGVAQQTYSRPPHRDYEPIWPDPESSQNPFKVAASTTTVLINSDPHSVTNQHHQQQHHPHAFPSNTNSIISSTGVDRGKPQKNRMESQVQDRMAEIKVLLEELRAPSKADESKQRSGISSKDATVMSPATQSFFGDKGNHHQQQQFMTTSTPGSTTSTSLKHHRSLRAPTRPQYQQQQQQNQGLSCFTFRKPSSFESITDQLYAEDVHNHYVGPPSSKERSLPPSITSMSTSSTQTQSEKKQGSSTSSFDQSFQRTERPQNGQRLNDYVSLRACRSSSATRKMEVVNSPNNDVIHPPQSNGSIPGSETMTPIPPPRSKRSGSLRRDQQSDYVNVAPNGSYQFGGKSNPWMVGGPESMKTNGYGDNQHHNGKVPSSTSTTTIRNESSSSSVYQHHPHQTPCTEHDLTKICARGGATLSNGNSTNHPTSPKAIIRALGLFQAKAANVRSRFANWAESRDRGGSHASVKRNHSAVVLVRKTDRSVERGNGNFSDEPSSRNMGSSVAGPSASSKHQYL